MIVLHMARFGGAAALLNAAMRNAINPFLAIAGILAVLYIGGVVIELIEVALKD